MTDLRSSAEYRTRWSELHGGYDLAEASPLVARYLSVMESVGRPLATARISPTALTGVGVGLAAVAAVLASSLPAVAALVALLSGLLDGLDGAVAVLRRRESSFGFVLDSVADRCADGLLLLALWRAGAAPAWCVLAAAGVVLLEYTRARAAGVGVVELGLVTVGERPTRLVLTVVGLLLAAAWSGAADLASAATAGVALVGWLQLLAFLRRRLAG